MGQIYRQECREREYKKKETFVDHMTKLKGRENLSTECEATFLDTCNVSGPVEREERKSFTFRKNALIID